MTFAYCGRFGPLALERGYRLRLYAPAARQVDALVDGRALPMERNGDWFAVDDPHARAGSRYAFAANGAQPIPDPGSRFQPDGVHAPSEIVAPHFAWPDDGWHGRPWHEHVIYELHVGAFTFEGTYEAAARKLRELVALGVTAVELMPVAAFPGERNWGYDGVLPYAPYAGYGKPNDLKHFIAAAHAHGLAVLLDVVYNHFGPEGNYLRQFSPDYFTNRYRTPWGDAINYDGCVWARKLAIDNATYWPREYHVDGLRLDATFAIYDSSPKHLLRELAEAVRAEKPRTILIAETHENDARYLKPLEAGGYGFDAVWADDFHHTIRRLVAGDREGYYQDYAGSVEEVAQTLDQGFLYEGQRSVYSGESRGTPARDRPAWQFVYCIQNHDQIGNRAFGDRLSQHLTPDLYRVVSTLLLLSPYTPMLFMGQEFAASSPFQYFTDHAADLGKLVTEGRRAEFESFAAFNDPNARERIPDPQAEKTFLNSKLAWPEAGNSPVLRLYQECLRLRREDPILHRHDRFSMEAAALTPNLLALRFGDSRILLANFGERTTVPAQGQIILDTNDPRFGSSDETATITPTGVSLPARTLVLLSVPSPVATGEG